MEDLLYIKYFAAFFLVALSFSVTYLLLRKIADFLIGMLLIAAIAAACTGIYNGAISSWSEITATSALLGIAGCLLCVPLIPFSSGYSNSGKSILKDKQEPAKSEAE